MNTAIQRQTAPDRLRKLAADLSAVGVSVPDDVAAQVALLDRLDATPPPTADTAALVAAYLAEKPAKELERLALINATAALRTEAWREARISAAQTGLRLIPTHGDDLARELAALAAPLIEKVTRAALIDTHDLTALLRHGREDDANVVASYALIVGELANLYDLRKRVTVGADYGQTPELARAVGVTGASCALWRDPRKALRHLGSGTDGWRDAIREGAELWFPLPAEASAQAATISAEVREAETAAEIDNRSRGFNVGLVAR